MRMGETSESKCVVKIAKDTLELTTDKKEVMSAGR